MLDPTLSYSCTVFERPDATLEEAGLAKLDLVCEKLDLGPRHHALEVGRGGGGGRDRALGAGGGGGGATARGAAAGRGGVTTTPLSRGQHAIAVARVREAGLGD